MPIKLKNNYIYIHILFSGILLIICFWGLFQLFGLHYAFPGTLSAKYDFIKKSPVIKEILPNGRLGELIQDKGLLFQEINIDPVYFSIDMPTNFVNQSLNLRFNKIGPKVFYVGPQVNTGFAYDLRPVYNSFLEDLYIDEDWNYEQTGDVVFFQKKNSSKQYSNLEEFILDSPDPQKIGVFNYTLTNDYYISGYQKSDRIKMFDVTFRGSHTILTYAENETLYYEFTIQDINRHQGEDDLTLTVVNNGNVVHTQILTDDGFSKDTDPASAKRKIKFTLSDIPDGVYKIELKTTEDVLIREIRTKSQYMVFANKVYLADNLEYSDGITDLDYSETLLYTNGRNFSFRTTHADGLQKVSLNDEEFDINETHKVFYEKRQVLGNDFISKLVSPKNDLIIESDGLFALSRKSFFDPRITNVNEHIDNLPEETEYIVARYEKVIDLGNDILERTFNFNLSKYYVKDKKLEFMISSPGLEKLENKLLLNQISAEFIKPKITFKEFFIKVKTKLLK